MLAEGGDRKTTASTGLIAPAMTTVTVDRAAQGEKSLPRFHGEGSSHASQPDGCPSNHTVVLTKEPTRRWSADTTRQEGTSAPETPTPITTRVSDTNPVCKGEGARGHRVNTSTRRPLFPDLKMGRSTLVSEKCL